LDVAPDAAMPAASAAFALAFPVNPTAIATTAAARTVEYAAMSSS
jgi:hypothetical protein